MILEEEDIKELRKGTGRGTVEDKNGERGPPTGRANHHHDESLS